jgi:hypothetical protein
MFVIVGAVGFFSAGFDGVGVGVGVADYAGASYFVSFFYSGAGAADPAGLGAPASIS